MPWLGQSDRMLVELACRLRVRILSDDAPLAAYSELRLCLSKMGGTPADRSRVEPGDGESDPLDHFFN